MERQHTVRRALRGLPHLMFGGEPRERAGDERLALVTVGVPPDGRMALTSPAFADGAPIPQVHAADDENLTPPLRWDRVPEGTRSLTLLVEDPDAPTAKPFLHWAVYDIPPTSESLSAALASGAHEGRNSALQSGWTGLAPPKGDRAHRYVFELFALACSLNLGLGAGRGALVDAMRGHVLATATLTGTYRR